MNLKPIITIFFILSFISFLLLYNDRKPSSSEKDLNIRGTGILTSKQIQETHYICIKKLPRDRIISLENGIQTKLIVDEDAANEISQLRKQSNGQWILPEYFNLPVKNSLIQDFLYDLSQIHYVRYLTNDKELVKEMDLSAIEIELKDNNREIIQKIGIGKSTGKEPYYYAFIEDKAYIIRHNTYFIGSDFLWADKSLIHHQPHDILPETIIVKGMVKNIKDKQDLHHSLLELIENEFWAVYDTSNNSNLKMEDKPIISIQFNTTDNTNHKLNLYESTDTSAEDNIYIQYLCKSLRTNPYLSRKQEMLLFVYDKNAVLPIFH